mmetsp:Transcript_35145/g.82019  ORF Transcript_35145/g.82019 Transcript_35145/m.82019 type:complete len:419 (-) Transcript_35145:67-1323(-)
MAWEEEDREQAASPRLQVGSAPLTPIDDMDESLVEAGAEAPEKKCIRQWSALFKPKEILPDPRWDVTHTQPKTVAGFDLRRTNVLPWPNCSAMYCDWQGFFWLQLPRFAKDPVPLGFKNCVVSLMAHKNRLGIAGLDLNNRPMLALVSPSDSTMPLPLQQLGVNTMRVEAIQRDCRYAIQSVLPEINGGLVLIHKNGTSTIVNAAQVARMTKLGRGFLSSGDPPEDPGPDHPVQARTDYPVQLAVYCRFVLSNMTSFVTNCLDDSVQALLHGNDVETVVLVSGGISITHPPGINPVMITASGRYTVNLRGYNAVCASVAPEVGRPVSGDVVRMAVGDDNGGVHICALEHLDQGRIRVTVTKRYPELFETAVAFLCFDVNGGLVVCSSLGRLAHLQLTPSSRPSSSSSLEVDASGPAEN